MRVNQHEMDELRRGLRGRYIIGPEIGVGGMSTVYRARDIRHERDVALKLLNGPSGDQFGRRFLREIRITARLQHPHILPLLDSGSVGRLLYFVTPYISGESLGRHLREFGFVAASDALRLTKEMAGALAHAHDNGIVHLDVKPANVLLSGGHAMVADFGIARAASENCGNASGGGVAAGTPAYMSPEQVVGADCLDGRSDVYSLACVLFEMLTGEPPFGAGDSTAVLSKHLHADPPSIKQRKASIPRFVDQTIRRALAKDPADRFPTMKAFANALEPRSLASVARRELLGAPRRLRVAGASFAFATLAAFGFSIAKPAATAPAVGQADPLVRAEPVVTGLDKAADVHIDPEVAKSEDPTLPC